MKRTTIGLLFGLICVSNNGNAQIEQLTPQETRYRDSITKLNQQNATVAASQEAYNKGIELFNQKNFTGAIAEFKKSVASDPNFTAAHYNKGVAENEAEQFKDAEMAINC